jgi:hypothetical protein
VAAHATALTVPRRAHTMGCRAGWAEMLLGRDLRREAATAYGPPHRKAEAMGRIRPMRSLPLFFFILYEYCWTTLRSELDQTHFYVVNSCTKLQEIKYKDICLQISAPCNALNFCMHVHTFVSILYKKFHDYFLFRIISRI